MRHKEYHRIERVGWLRAAVLGANDGIISTASLLIGVAAAQNKKRSCHHRKTKGDNLVLSKLWKKYYNRHQDPITSYLR